MLYHDHLTSEDASPKPTIVTDTLRWVQVKMPISSGVSRGISNGGGDGRCCLMKASQSDVLPGSSTTWQQD